MRQRHSVCWSTCKEHSWHKIDESI
jgi:hypothetical protein